LPTGEHGHTWIEFRVGNCSLMLFPNGDQTPPGAHETWVFVDDLDAHLRHSRAHKGRRSSVTSHRRDSALIRPRTWRATAGPSLKPDPTSVKPH
jgi:hypothetical protein